jgi:hypothetical protein
MGKLTVADARQVDMVDYLSSLGFQAMKVRGDDFWYLSPLRNEHTASFKVNRRDKIWYDHGSGEGGNIIDFGILYHKLDVKGFLELLAKDYLRNNLSFQQQRPRENNNKISTSHSFTTDSKIIVTATRPIDSPRLMHYLESRAIPVDLARQVCMEVDFQLYKKQHTAIGFPNDAGGYELRNAYFKGSSSPKTFRYIHNGSRELEVFEGMFDFLSWLSVNAKQLQPANFLILNSLSFFQKARFLMEGHTKINLWLDRGTAGEACTRAALRSHAAYEDKSSLYKALMTSMNGGYTMLNKKTFPANNKILTN